MISLTAERKGRRRVRSCLNQGVWSCDILMAIKQVNTFMPTTDKKHEFLSLREMSHGLNPH